MSSINRRDFGIAMVATMLLPVSTARARTGGAYRQFRKGSGQARVYREGLHRVAAALRGMWVCP